MWPHQSLVGHALLWQHTRYCQSSNTLYCPPRLQSADEKALEGPVIAICKWVPLDSPTAATWGRKQATTWTDSNGFIPQKHTIVITVKNCHVKNTIDEYINLYSLHTICQYVNAYILSRIKGYILKIESFILFFKMIIYSIFKM